MDPTTRSSEFSFGNAAALTEVETHLTALIYVATQNGRDHSDLDALLASVRSRREAFLIDGSRRARAAEASNISA